MHRGCAENCPEQFLYLQGRRDRGKLSGTNYATKQKVEKR